MKWSFKLVRLWGIDVYLHVTFLLLLGFIGVEYGLRTRNVAAALGSVSFVSALFLCVLFHEYGHALAARRYGIKTRDITLLPIGGVARLERLPTEPVQELVVAIAGPLVNVIIAGALLVGMKIGGMPILTSDWVESPNFVQRLFFVNVMLVLFNLLPAFPMDGGRVLRAFLAMITDPVKATQIAAVIGRGMAIVFAVTGIFLVKNPFLVLIAVFVWFGAGAEARAMTVRALIDRATVARAMITNFYTLAPEDPLSRAAQLVIAGSQQDFPVVDGGRMVGVLDRQRLFAALTQSGERTPVASAMSGEVLVVQAGEPLEEALMKLQASGAALAAVEHGGRLVGILTVENASEFMLIQQAQSRQTPPVIIAPPPLSR